MLFYSAYLVSLLRPTIIFLHMKKIVAKINGYRIITIEFHEKIKIWRSNAGKVINLKEYGRNG